ncbi:MAG TPA: carboxypeptidase-like regulatory domain-containing protein [Candidatus Elarobacter sp.]|nr:carboxypeptidase-like regulatory domain-containing protein [Candidatus Elarobacter sp.]
MTYSTSATPFAYNAPTLRGYNNALIVLDGRITQRTDSSGEFEFRFVPPGAHTIRIDAATIQPGLISDREYQTVTVLGGQTTTIQFNVGNFAGVAGTVVAADANGKKRGLGGVGIAIDGIQAVTTTPDGHYAIGRLSPGAHTVEIVESTLPTSVAFVADKKKTVTVTPGTSTPLNFVATPLGSIAGNVVAPSDGGFGQLTGLKNVYVVAEPGEHAVITDDDGSFLMDNMPPGTYTLSVDADTIPDGLGVLSGPDGPVALEGGAALSGIVFKLGAAAKNVVFTFNDGKRQAIQVTTDPSVVPPGGLLRIQARSSAKDVKEMVVESDVFGGFPLRLDPRLGVWTGTVVVPSLVKGDYALSVSAHRKDVTDASALIAVDPRIPLFAYRISPRDAEPGHTIRVTLKSVASVEEGDAILFEDGYKVLLPKPTGHVFAFDMRLWHKGLPYSGSILTKRGQSYPLSLR